MPDFISAVNAHGHKQIIPAHWLDHPILGVGFKLPPSSEARPPQHRPQKQADKQATEADQTKE